MDEALFTLSEPKNEPILGYLPGSPERLELEAQIEKQSNEQVDIPLIIGGQEVRTGDLGTCVMPHNHSHVLGVYHKAGKKEVEAARAASQKAWKEWSQIPWPERVSVFLKAAELLAGPWRAKINAGTMLTQSKTVYQAEIDAACESVDFFRYNAHFVDRIYSQQPASTLGIWDRLEWRPLEGFVFAVTPFNFTSIAANLPSAPAMMGNTVIWKPASSSVYSSYQIMKLFTEAGLPEGVINFVPGSGKVIGETVLGFHDLAGIHFTGSTQTFRSLWQSVGNNIASYRSYPRVVGETGGKDFVVAHHSANTDALACGLIRGAFEYQGQKCSAASRAYIPESLWPVIETQLKHDASEIEVGDPKIFQNFMGAVIDEKAFDRIAGYIDFARKAEDARIVAGGGYDKSKGYFVEPTVILTTNPHFKTMEEEIFGPVLTIYVYPDNDYEKILELCNETSPYALTGAVFAADRRAIHLAHRKLRHAAGNFYVNDKPTGAVVGQQPFGGSRASGTNDKAGSMLNLLRWVTPRTIKETFVPPTNYKYPYMQKE